MANKWRGDGKWIPIHQPRYSSPRKVKDIYISTLYPTLTPHPFNIPLLEPINPRISLNSIPRKQMGPQMLSCWNLDSEGLKWQFTKVNSSNYREIQKSNRELWWQSLMGIHIETNSLCAHSNKKIKARKRVILIAILSKKIQTGKAQKNS